MDSVVCLSGKDFCLVMYDIENFKSILKTKDNLDKSIEIGKNKLLIISGNAGEVAQFSDFIQKSLQFLSLKTKDDMSTHSAANLIRKRLSDSLRKSPVKINITILGYDSSIGPAIFRLDYTGNLHRANFIIQGYPSFFLSSLLACHYEENISLETGMSIIVKCVVLIKNRFLANQKNFLVKMVNREGINFLGLV